MTSYLLGHKITIPKKSIANFFGHDGSGKQCRDILAKKSKMATIVEIIFMNGKPSSNPRNLHQDIRIWFKIILGCIHHRPCSNSPDYINTDQKYKTYPLFSSSI